MRGLKNFITECLECQTKELEKARVNKELSNVRKNFGGSSLNGYNRKKYVAKLLYIHLLGYNFDFGFPQMIELLASPVFSEKQIGYITLGVLLNGNYELVTMLIEHIRKEMKNFENEPAQCLALAAAANIGGREIAETLSGTILQTLSNPRNSDFVKKTACLALCRLYRETPSVIVLDPTFIESLNQLLFSSNYGVQLSAAALINVLITRNASEMNQVFNSSLLQLSRIFDVSVPEDYCYGRNPIPWLILKYMRILQHKQEWAEEETHRISHIIDICLQKADVTLSVKEVHSNMILLFEAINLIIARQFSPEYMQRCATILGGFLSAKQPNVRYLALETLTRLVQTDNSVISSLDQHRQTLYLALRDPDNSIRRRTLSLLFAVCTKESAEEIVHELLNYLRFADITMREPLCLKIAVMAEQFAEDPAWFVDVVLQLIAMAGDECNDGVWYRVVQVVSKVPGLQRYAAMTSFASMQQNAPHDRLICLCAQLVGEYIHLTDIRPEEAVGELISKYRIGSNTAKGIIVSALAKIGARYAPARQTCLEFISGLRGSQCIDIQQRAIEYTAMLTAAQNVLMAVFKPIPAFEKKTSSLLRKVLEEQREDFGDGEEDFEEEEDDARPENFVTTMPSRSAQPAAAVPAPQAPGDLLGLGPQQPQQQPQQAVADKLGLDDLLAPSQPVPPGGQPSGVMELLSSPAAGQPLAPQFPSPKEIFRGFLSADQGVAFEDMNARVQLSISMNGPQAILAFQIANKTSGILNNVGIHIPPQPCLRIQPRPGANTINRGEATVYQFAIIVTAPYIDPPSYNFRYRWNETPTNEVIQLPLPITKFMNPFNMDQNVFFSRWNSLSAPNLTASAQFPAPAGDPTAQLRQIMTSLLKVPVLPLQVPPGNVCGAGVINCESGVLGILSRFFTDGSGMVNVQIKGTTPQITAAIQKILDLYFAK